MKGISIKSQEEIELMREAGRILAITHEEMRKALKPGMTTYDIDKLGELSGISGVGVCICK